MNIYLVAYLFVAFLIISGVYSYAIINSIYEANEKAIKKLNDENTRLIDELIKLKDNHGT